MNKHDYLRVSMGLAASLGSLAFTATDALPARSIAWLVTSPVKLGPNRIRVLVAESNLEISIGSQALGPTAGYRLSPL